MFCGLYSGEACNRERFILTCVWYMFYEGCVTTELNSPLCGKLYHSKTRRTDFLNKGKIAKDSAISMYSFSCKKLGTCFDMSKEYKGKNVGNISI